MRRDKIAQRGIRARDSGAHLLGLHLPLARRALRLGQYATIPVGSSLTPRSLQFNGGVSTRDQVRTC